MHSLPLLRMGFAALLATAIASSSDELPNQAVDYDLESYISRPDIRAPKFSVEAHRPDMVCPGYWFVSPYGDLERNVPSPLYLPPQTGPHIYDGKGELVWSGAYLASGDRPILDFKLFEADHAQYMSLLLLSHPNALWQPAGAGIIFDSSFTEHALVSSQVGTGVENMHEFNVIDNGRRALMITHQNNWQQLVREDGRLTSLRSVGNPGFVEKDVATGETLFEWWSFDHLSPYETYLDLPGGVEVSWDWLHINSVDKDANGDYLISGRHASTIYKISGRDGSILWRLGGRNSSFHLDGFNFSSQHDARFRSHADVLAYGAPDPPSPSTTYVSFLNNAADSGRRNTSSHSSGMILALDAETWTATLVRAFPRPDGELTYLRGNLQLLPNANVMVAWSENAYMTEFGPDGSAVLDARFVSQRFVQYRGYKFNLSSRPAEPPVFKGFVHGEARGTATSSFYISWNGATEVVRWVVWGSGEDGFQELGAGERTGFETVVMKSGCYERGYVEAVAADGTVLGTSEVEDLALPYGWGSCADDGAAQPARETGIAGYAQSDPLGAAGDRFTASVSYVRSGVRGRETVWSLALVAAVCAMSVAMCAVGRSRARRSRLRRAAVGEYKRVASA